MLLIQPQLCGACHGFMASHMPWPVHAITKLVFVSFNSLSARTRCKEQSVYTTLPATLTSCGTYFQVDYVFQKLNDVQSVRRAKINPAMLSFLSEARYLI